MFPSVLREEDMLAKLEFQDDWSGEHFGLGIPDTGAMYYWMNMTQVKTALKMLWYKIKKIIFLSAEPLLPTSKQAIT